MRETREAQGEEGGYRTWEWRLEQEKGKMQGHKWSRREGG